MTDITHDHQEIKNNIKKNSLDKTSKRFRQILT
jgi:hypothetical protein